MATFELSTRHDLEDFVRGVVFLGVGGGGRGEDGLAHLVTAAEEGITLRVTDLSEIPDEEWLCVVYGMGSIAPAEPSREKPYGLDAKVVRRPMVEAVKALEEYAKVKIGAVAIFEPGGANSPKALEAGMRHGSLVPDGDFCGRAVPEMHQTLAAIRGIVPFPIAICDDWGHRIFLAHAPTLHSAEAIGKYVSVITKAPDPLATCAHAAYLMKVSLAKEVMVGGTMSLALKIGRAVRMAREEGKDPVVSITEASGGKMLFRGKVARVDWESSKGYMSGTTWIDGSDGTTYSIWFKNENHLARKGEKAVCMSPDLIHVVDSLTGEPITNTKMAAGMDVSVIGTPNRPFRNGPGIDCLSPAYFGFDQPYVPFENL
jgi:DUF917 family protein